MTVKNLAFSAAMSATARAGGVVWYLSRFTYLFNWDRSTHKRYAFAVLLGVMTMGAHHSMASVTFSMIPCCSSNSNSDFNLSRYAKGMDLGVLTQKGTASSVSEM